MMTARSIVSENLLGVASATIGRGASLSHLALVAVIAVSARRAGALIVLAAVVVYDGVTLCALLAVAVALVSVPSYVGWSVS